MATKVWHLQVRRDRRRQGAARVRPPAADYAECQRLKDDLAFAQACIVDLQHIIREQRHEIDNLQFVIAQTRPWHRRRRRSDDR
jgi:hypothetical protein